VRKYPLAAAAVERLVSNMIGTGIKPQISDKAINDLWLRWTDESDTSGMLDFYGVQALVARSVIESGEAFIRFRLRPAHAMRTVPLQLEVLESDHVDFAMNLIGENGNPIRQGIELNKDMPSQRVAYWVFPEHPADPALDPSVPNVPIRVPAHEIMHVYLPTRPGQLRGEPWLCRILDKLRDLDDYAGAELVRKRTVANFVGFIERVTPEGMSIDDLAEMWGDADDAYGPTVSMEAGSMQLLAPGESVTFTDVKDMAGSYEIYMRTAHRDIAAALGILYEQLTGDYSAMNDRIWRGAVNEFRRRIEMHQHQLIVYQFARPVYARWASVAAMQGYDVDPDMPVVWVPQAHPHIHPLQDVQALREEIRAGFTSRRAVVASRGEDSEVIDAEQADDNKRADTLNLIYESDGRVNNSVLVPAEVAEEVESGLSKRLEED
jgi:lambda family phage portal protein